MCSEATVKYKHGVSSGYVMKQYYCESIYLLEYLLKFCFKSVYIICFYIYSKLLRISLGYAFNF